MDVTSNVDPKVGQVAEGKKYDFLPESAIGTKELKVFEFGDVGQRINILTKEFSAVCPFSGLPDIAEVEITYYPQGKVAVELKALKYYFTSFRNVGIYQEAVTTRIYKDLLEVLKLTGPEQALEVTTRYNVRGGFYTTCTKGGLRF